MLKIPPPIWMFLYLAIAGAASMARPWKSVSDWTNVPLGIALVAVGVLIATWGRYTFYAEGTEANPLSSTNKMLVQHGPYSITRNPMYLGLTLFSLGIAFWTGSLPMFAVPVAVFVTANMVHIPFEEEKMRRQFGAEFDAYTARVRRWV